MVEILKKISHTLFTKRMKRIHAFSAMGQTLQQEMLMRFVRRAEQTEYGKQYNFTAIQSYEDFQKQVPLVAYEDIESFILRMRAGEENILWPTAIDFFSKSSGTTGSVSKFIPVSYEFLQECHYRGGKDMLAIYLSQFPNSGLFFGKTFSLSGSLSHADNTSVQTGDVSAVLVHNLPLWARAFRTPPQDIALLSNWEEKSEKIIKHISQEDIRAFAGAPAWVLAILKGVKKYTGVSSLQELWPNLEVFFYGGTSIKPFEDELNSLVGRPLRYMSIYNASEGFFGLQDTISAKGEMLLMLDYDIFYEFLEFPNKSGGVPVDISGLVVGHQYEVIITTSSGLWRYRIGDVIQITSLNPIRFTITGRTKQCINVYGEELMVHNAEDALQHVCQLHNALISEFTVAPIFQTSTQKGGHEWLIEFTVPPRDISLFTKDLDKALRERNSDYDAKRNETMGVLQQLTLLVAPQGTFVAWLASKNKLGGQHKVPRLSSERTYLEEIQSFISKIDV